MIKRFNSTWTIALFAAVAVATPLAAQAADPAKPSADPRASMTQEQLAQQNAIALKKFEAERAEVAKQPAPTEYLMSKRPEYKAPQRAATQQPIEVRVEKFYDGGILYSKPIGKDDDKVIYNLGLFRKVDRKEQIGNNAVFDGRVYIRTRVHGTEAQWQELMGKTIDLTALNASGGLPPKIKK